RDSICLRSARLRCGVEMERESKHRRPITRPRVHAPRTETKHNKRQRGGSY
ncbi:hypothetical protein COCCADRAFT_112192, partial [Bipolaris zeicola 26-R-13]